MSREVVTLWATRKSIDAGMYPPEMIQAWDEFSIEENAEGWFSACKKALDAFGDDLDQYRYITLRVAESVIDEAFFHTISAVTSARVSGPNGE
jgi:hypothetical protein